MPSLLADEKNFSLPDIVKPVDSSGSKGVSKIHNWGDIPLAFEISMSYSRCKRIIVEEYIESKGAQLHGDAFVMNNEVVFSYLGDHHYDNSIHNLVPYATTFPSLHTTETIQRVEEELQRLIELLGFKEGGINVEVRISKVDNKIYFIDVGPRNGGNYTPVVIQYASGFNFIDAALDVALGKEFQKQRISKKGFYAYLIPHSQEDGVLLELHISEELIPYIIESHIYKHKSDRVASFKGANAALGALIVKFSSMAEMKYFATHFSNYYSVELAK